MGTRVGESGEWKRWVKVGGWKYMGENKGGWNWTGEFYWVFQRVWQRVSVKVVGENVGWRCMDQVENYSWEGEIRQWSFVHTFSRIFFMCLRMSSPTQSPMHGVDGDIMCSCNKSYKSHNSLSPPRCPTIYICRWLFFVFPLFLDWWPTLLFKFLMLPSIDQLLHPCCHPSMSCSIHRNPPPLFRWNCRAKM